MAVEIASAYVSIFPRFKDLGSTINKELGGVDMDGSGRQMGGKFVGGFGSSLGKLAAVAATAFAGLQIGGFLKDSIGAASSLSETINKSNVVFGDQGGVMRDWAKTAAKSFGQSQQGALDAAASFGNMFKQLGVGSKEAAKMSVQMVELASDFASFHDADPTEVLLAMQSAFRGEYDAVQKFVPTITAASVELKAMEMGLAGSTKELTAQDKALATQALLMQGAGDAIGDFARTSDSFANQQRTLNALWQEGKVALGELLMPAAVAISEFLISKGIPAFIDGVAGVRAFVKAFADGADGLAASGFARSMGELGIKARELFDEWAPRIKDAFDLMADLAVKAWENRDALAAVIIPLGTFVLLVEGLGKAMMAMKTAGSITSLAASFAPLVVAAGPVAIVVAIIAALGVAAFIAYKKFEPFRNVVDAVARVVADKAVAAFNFLRNTFETVWPAISSAVTTAIGIVRTAITSAAAFFTDLGAKAMALWTAIVTALGPLGAWFNTHVVSTLAAGWALLVALFQGAGTLLGPVFTALQAVITLAVQSILVMFNIFWTTTSTIFQAIFIIISTSLSIWASIFGIFISVVGAIWGPFWDQIQNVVSTIFNHVRIVIETVLGIIRGIFQAVTGLIRGDWDQFWQGISTIASSIFNGVRDIISNIWESIQTTFNNALNAVVTAVTTTFDGIIRFFEGIPGRITGAIGDLGRLLYNAGKDVVQGLIDGINDMIPSVDSALGAISNMIPFAKGPPVKDKVLLFPNGQLIMQGLMAGIGSEIPAVMSQLSGLTMAIPPTVQARAGVGAMRMHAGWEPSGSAAGAAGAGIVVNVANPIPRAEDVADAIGWASRRLAR